MKGPAMTKVKEEAKKPGAAAAKVMSAVRGRGALNFLDTIAKTGRQTEFIDVDRIRPDPKNMRSKFRPIDGVVPAEVLARLRELADNIAARGLEQPIGVCQDPDRGPGYWQIVFGERRWRAFVLNRELGRDGHGEIEVLVREGSPHDVRQRLAQMSENLHREDLSDLEWAAGLQDMLTEYPELQQKDLCELINKPKQWVSRILGLLDPRYAELITEGFITHATILEHYKTLPQESRERVVRDAAAAGTRITKGRIDTEKVRVGTKGATPPPVHTPARTGDATSMPSAALAQQTVRIRLGQLDVLRQALPDGADPSLTVTLDVADIRAVLEALGAKPVASDVHLTQQLMDVLNATQRASKKT